MGFWGRGIMDSRKDWSAIDRSRDGYIRIRDGYIRIRDGLDSEGEVQEMDDEENFTTRGCTRPVFVDFSWRTTRCLLIVGGSCSIQRTWSIITSLR